MKLIHRNSLECVDIVAEVIYLHSNSHDYVLKIETRIIPSDHFASLYLVRTLLVIRIASFVDFLQ